MDRNLDAPSGASLNIRTVDLLSIRCRGVHRLSRMYFAGLARPVLLIESYAILSQEEADHRLMSLASGKTEVPMVIDFAIVAPNACHVLSHLLA